MALMDNSAFGISALRNRCTCPNHRHLGELAPHLGLDPVAVRAVVAVGIVLESVTCGMTNRI